MRKEEFEECYQKYYPLVVRYAYEMTQNYEAAEDIAQEVFASFYKNIRSIVPGLERAWLCRAAKYAAMDYFRKISRTSEIRLEVGRLDWEFPLPADGIGLLEKRLDDEILIRDILASLEETYPLWYEALYLSCVEDMSFEEAARMLGVTSAVMRARAYRARVYIREHFQREQE
ncbi:MAG: RNA polymerase sigma factor [Lachnospiraceae bacterium]|nr:RNA polymerase sigma factor [Lachnospiraceae bacterium]